MRHWLILILNLFVATGYATMAETPLTEITPDGHAIRADGVWLKDKQGRTLMLRGVSLGGSSKVPYRPNGATHIQEGFFQHRDVSFVGRPFPLEEAGEHFARLRDWGLTTVRFVVTWEAVEHAGPGQYDQDYLQYLYDVIAEAARYDIQVLIDSHQDAWSRWTGGDGAPGWTLEAIGMDLRRLHTTGATITQATHNTPYPHMIWTTNYIRYGTATLFTLFFAGNDFAPELKIDGVPVQDYLQGHYFEAMRQVAMAVKDLPNVIGFGTLNEPGRGYIGVPGLTDVAAGLMVFDLSPTPLQGMLAAAGYSQQVAVINRDQVTGSATLNAAGDTLWRDGITPVWKQHGVWTDEGGEPLVLKNDYFSQVNGRPVDFARDYLMPFIRQYAETIRSVIPDTVVFIEPTSILNAEAYQPVLAEGEIPNVVFAPKWYDGPTLATKTFYPWLDDIGREGIRHSFTGQLAQIKARAAARVGDIPVAIGEFGLPMDLDQGHALKTGDYGKHEAILDSYFNAMDSNLLSAFIWNYTPDNVHAHGDQWNGEDFSIFSRDHERNGGGRALGGVVRPYAMRTAGEPLRMRFQRQGRVFEYEFRPDITVHAPTEIFIPALQYPDGYRVTAEGAQYQRDPAHQRLRIHADRGASLVRVRVEP